MSATSLSLTNSLRVEADAYSDAAETVRYYGTLARREAGIDGLERLGADRALRHVAGLLDREAKFRRNGER